MRNKLLTYCLFAFFALALSNGAVIAAFSDVIPATGPAILLSALPLALLMLIAAWINRAVLIPQLFIRQRYIQYLALCFIIALAIPLVGIAMEGAIRDELQLPHRIHNYLSPWILVDSLSTASLLMVIMVAMGVVEIYRQWQEEACKERLVAHQYSDAIQLLTKRISPTEITSQLTEIKVLIPTNPDDADRSLRNLSEKLRRELYDLPKIAPSDVDRPPVAPKLAEFISGKRFTLLRDICLKLLIAAVSVTAIFEASDTPNLSLDGLWAFLGMFLIVSIITYGNKSLCKHFLNKGKLKQYLAGCGIFLIIMTLATIIVEYNSYVHTIYNGAPTVMYTILATISSFCTLALFLGGITALIVLHNWLRTVRKVDALRAETIRTEFEFLQSQINPHFLFNVLNNTSILIHEMPDMASDMLSQLAQMFNYQHLLDGKESVRLSDELDFLRNYLLLEQSRKSPFRFEITVNVSPEKISVPPLLFIPFVENASKHSCGNRDIRLTLSDADSRWLIFECENNAKNESEETKSANSGLGIANTRRRLELLYGNDYHLHICKLENSFKVTLYIPLKYEMPDCRR